jgi:large subunit ribosomal protein L4
MDIKVTKLDGKAAGKVEVSDEVFGLEPRADLLQRMVRYQLAKRQTGNHKTKAACGDQPYGC